MRFPITPLAAPIRSGQTTTTRVLTNNHFSQAGNCPRILGQFPAWLKWLLVSTLVVVVWPLLIGAASGVMGNLITPHVQAYLDETQGASQREQAKGLRKLSFSELGIELRGYRF